MAEVGVLTYDQETHRIDPVRIRIDSVRNNSPHYW